MPTVAFDSLDSAVALRKSSTAVKRADNKPRKASWLGGASSKKNLSKLVGLVGELRKSGHKYFCSWRIPLMILWLTKLMDISSKLLWISFIRTNYAPVHEMNSANIPLIIDGTPSKDMVAVGVNHPKSEQVGFGMFWVGDVFQDPKLLTWPTHCDPPPAPGGHVQTCFQGEAAPGPMPETLPYRIAILDWLHYLRSIALPSAKSVPLHTVSLARFQNTPEDTASSLDRL